MSSLDWAGHFRTWELGLEDNRWRACWERISSCRTSQCGRLCTRPVSRCHTLLLEVRKYYCRKRARQRLCTWRYPPTRHCTRSQSRSSKWQCSRLRFCCCRRRSSRPLRSLRCRRQDSVWNRRKKWVLGIDTLFRLCSSCIPNCFCCRITPHSRRCCSRTSNTKKTGLKLLSKCSLNQVGSWWNSPFCCHYHTAHPPQGLSFRKMVDDYRQRNSPKALYTRIQTLANSYDNQACSHYRTAHRST